MDWLGAKSSPASALKYVCALQKAQNHLQYFQCVGAGDGLAPGSHAFTSLGMKVCTVCEMHKFWDRP